MSLGSIYNYYNLENTRKLVNSEKKKKTINWLGTNDSVNNYAVQGVYNDSK